MTAKALSAALEAQVVAEYLGGESSNVLAPRYGVSGATICHILKRYGHKMRPSGSRWTGTPEQIETVVRLYLQGTTVEEIALKVGTHQSTVSRTLRENNVIVRVGPARRCIKPEQYDDIVRRYESGETLRAIARSLSITTPPVMEVLQKRNVVRRIGGTSTFWTPERIQEAARLYRAGYTSDAIGVLWSVSASNVSKILRRDGVATRRPAMRGSQHASWKGGRYLKKDGYILICNEDGSGYVLEHRKVMAEHIGRPLKRTESVHHIDGNRQNNDISNLQLRFGKHGNGIVLRCGDCESRNIISTPL